MTEIIVQDDVVSVCTQNVSVTLGADVANVSVENPVVYGLPDVNVLTPLTFDAVAGNFSIAKSDSSHDGYISLSDWNLFNNKQIAGNYITALSGDGTAAGAGNATLTLANVSSDVGTFNNLTVNAKGLVTNGSNVDYQPAYSAFTANQLLFGNATSTPTQDSSLYWDNINKRLGVGATPNAATEILATSEQLRLSYDGTNHTSFTVDDTSAITVTPGVDATPAVNFTMADGLTSVLSIDTVNGFVGINNTLPTAFLDIPPATFNNASLGIRTTGATPFTTSNGDVWQDGTHCYMIIGTTKVQLDNPPGGFNYKEIATSTGNLVANTIHYINNNTFQVALTLPSAFNENDYFGIIGKGTGGWKIKQYSGQTIHFGTSSTTTGTGGSITSTIQYNNIALRGLIANTALSVESSVGALTIV